MNFSVWRAIPDTTGNPGHQEIHLFPAVFLPGFLGGFYFFKGDPGTDSKFDGLSWEHGSSNLIRDGGLLQDGSTTLLLTFFRYLTADPCWENSFYVWIDIACGKMACIMESKNNRDGNASTLIAIDSTSNTNISIYPRSLLNFHFVELALHDLNLIFSSSDNLLGVFPRGAHLQKLAINNQVGSNGSYEQSARKTANAAAPVAIVRSFNW